MSERDSTCAVEYRPIPGFPGFLAGCDGTIVGKNGKLNQYSDRRGYKIVSVRRDSGLRTNQRVHRLVLMAFMGPCPEGMEGCHNDGNRLNNTLGNLRWDTHRANLRDIETHGTRRRGEKCSQAKLAEADVRLILSKLIGGSRRRPLAEQFGVSVDTINRIATGSIWGHIKCQRPPTRLQECNAVAREVLIRMGRTSFTLLDREVVEAIADALWWTKDARIHVRVAKAIRECNGDLKVDLIRVPHCGRRMRVTRFSLPEGGSRVRQA